MLGLMSPAWVRLMAVAMLAVLACGPLVAQQATANYGQTHRFPGSFKPAQVTVGPAGSTSFRPATPTGAAEPDVGASVGVRDAWIDPPPDPTPIKVTAEVIKRWLTQLRSFRTADVKEATAGLTATGNPAIAPILGALDSAASREQVLMLRILAAIGTPEADCALADLAASSPRTVVETEALAHLQRKQSTAARERLVQLTVSAEPAAGKRVIRTLCMVGDQACIPDLIAHLPTGTGGGGGPAVTTAPAKPPPLCKAGVALQALTGEAYGNSAGQWKSWWKAKRLTFRFAAP